MNIEEVCSRDVYFVRPADSLADAVAEMHRRHIGALVVVDQRPDLVRPIGIVTDRDAIRAQVMAGKPLSRLLVADAMTSDPLTLPASCGLAEAVEQMGARAVRRAPVVAESGDLVGIVSFDDLLPVIAKQIGIIAGLIGAPARPAVGA